VITASSANLLWWLQQFFNLKFWIPTGICRRDLTLTDEIALLEQIKKKPLTTVIANCWSTEIYNCTSSTKAR
jgi:hypothetical protein